MSEQEDFEAMQSEKKVAPELSGLACSINYANVKGIKKSRGGPITSKMRQFLDWMYHHSLVDLQVSGGSFTWSKSNHQFPPTMSKLDRFLFSRIGWTYILRYVN